MKIHDLNGGHRHVGENKQKRGVVEKEGFHQIMEQYRDTERKTTTQGLKTLIADSASLSSGDIKHEIDLACDCKTGENIDMTRLGELLRLYKEVNN
ncbi:MAG: hypothetical protein FWE91_02670 [Defluviitaleaceae bacterium]|nr:hypothetical protein [Defluviitaleaceae bacterium]MCL2835567.1 hypothetical protein [Defluviitaleaceae bacterium]